MRLLATALFTASMIPLLAACGSEPAAEEAAPTEMEAATPEAAPEPVAEETMEPTVDTTALSWALAGEWRSEDAAARDTARHPEETLSFFQIDPSSRVMEIWPGGGWYADVIAPWITANGGQYIAAWPGVDPENERSVAFFERFSSRFGNETFGELESVDFNAESGPLGEPGSVDAIVTFRNTHSWMGRGMAEKAFADFYDVLIPGGVLGLVQHRLPADQVQDPRAGTGYVQQDLVISMAQEAGFELVEASEINANAADTADHPFGVWTLPPVARTSAFGEPADPEFDRAPYDAIGESDRMTLLFRKPVDTGEADMAESTDG